MPSAVAKKPSKPEPPKRPPINRTGVPITFYLDPRLVAWFRHLAKKVNRRAVSQELAMAMEVHLKAVGIDPYSPPPPADPGDKAD